MPKKKAVKVNEPPKKSYEEIEAENRSLMLKVDALAKQTPEMQDVGVNYLKELQKIDTKARVDTLTIKVQDFTDHKNISLWTKDGKRIGPLHRDNCIATLKRFMKLGIQLTVDQPTPEQLKTYRNTDEYKRKAVKEEKRRYRQMQSKKTGQLEKLAAAIAKMAGVSVNDINSVLDSNEIKSLTEGHRVMK